MRDAVPPIGSLREKAEYLAQQSEVHAMIIREDYLMHLTADHLQETAQVIRDLLAELDR